MPPRGKPIHQTKSKQGGLTEQFVDRETGAESTTAGTGGLLIGDESSEDSIKQLRAGGDPE